MTAVRRREWSCVDGALRCVRCEELRAARIYHDHRNRVVDSDGGIVVAEGWICHVCLGEAW